MAVSDHVDFPTFMQGVKKRNPGQDEFDVKYEHESIWTTKPKRDRDDDEKPAKKKST